MCAFVTSSVSFAPRCRLATQKSSMAPCGTCMPSRKLSRVSQRLLRTFASEEVVHRSFVPLTSSQGKLKISPPEEPTALKPQSFDFLVLGSGIAGLSYALKVAEYGRVAIITKASAEDGCTAYAQGGISAVMDAADSAESHIHDTMVAGGFLNIPEAVEAVCREGPTAVLELITMGAEFTRNGDGSLHLTKEGGHSARRVVHAADVTGREIERALVAAARAQPNVTLFEHHLAVDLVVDEVFGSRTCLGVDVLNQKLNAMERFIAPVTMLATGGCGQVYPNTTNPLVSTGDGMAMAYRARAVVANMEFVQFHPTGFAGARNKTGGRCFLISEAVRGEGGLLFNAAGERFMGAYDDRMELAPRDVVARAIQDQMLLRGEPHMLLDISHRPSKEVLHHFPNIAAQCLAAGIDITKQPIPVVPTQHYMCGGVRADMAGKTSVAGLFACGEVACTGLHGANRLASNSLLEGLVFARRAVNASVEHAEWSAQHAGAALLSAEASGPGSRVPKQLTAPGKEWVAARRADLQQVMWESAGIVRSQATMKAALDRLASAYVETKALAEGYGLTTELIELQNLVTVGELIVSSALQRKESRGLHYCIDYPHQVDDQRHDTVIEKALRHRVDLSNIRPLPNRLLQGMNLGRSRERTSRPRDLILRSKKVE